MAGGDARRTAREGDAALADRFPAGLHDGLRRHTARGTLINAAFQIGLAALTLARRLVVAAFLTVAEFGVWGVLLATVLTVLFIKEAGIGDKFVQQTDNDEERAFQQAFTIDLLLGMAALALAAVALPVVALAYGHPELIVPGLILSLAIPLSSLQFPIWIYYRRMDFVRQRTLQAVEPVVGFAATVGLAAAGAGYWSLIWGGLAGLLVGGLVAWRASPYPLAILRLKRGVVRDYFGFSWPLVVARGGGILTGQISLLLATRTIGLAGAGAIGLAGSISTFTRGVDGIVTQTLYPAICAVRTRTELLFEAFVKSNRLALMWGVPFGLGLALFAPDLVHFALGDRWEPAIVLLQAFGVAAALDQFGFNWTAFLRALDRTRPLATMAGLTVLTYLLIPAPLLVAFGLEGFAIGWIASQALNVLARTYYLVQLFPGFGVVRHAARAVTPVVPAVVVILALRAIETGDRTAGLAAAEVLLYVGVTIGATMLIERSLLREVVGYLRRRTRDAAVADSSR